MSAAFALVLSEVSAAAMQVFLDGFAATLPERGHAALLLDGAGWHTAADITVPANISLIFLSPDSPQLNPVERLWLFLRERYLSLRLFADLSEIIDGCCDAWNRLTAEPGRIASLTNYPYLRSVRSSWGGYYNRLATLLACFLAGVMLVIVRRVAGTIGFAVQPQRWVVGRSIGWLGRWRRLSKNYEALPQISEAMITLALIRLMLHRLAHPSRRRLPAP